MNKERLLRLADRMDKVKPEHFDITYWHTVLDANPSNRTDQALYASPRPYHSIPDYVEYTKKGDRKIMLREGFCGSAACVLGQAALIKEFNDQGLYVDLTGDGMNAHDNRASIVFFDDQNVYFGVDAGAKFFDLTEIQAMVMFYVRLNYAALQFYGARNSKEITPQKVAQAIRTFVETDGESMKPYI